MACGSFWWKDILGLVDSYRNVSWVMVNRGDTVPFWTDFWQLSKPVVPLQQANKVIKGFSFAKDPFITVYEVLQCSDLSTLFHLPLSDNAFQELQAIQGLLANFNRDRVQDKNDIWSWSNSDKSYTAKRYYEMMIHSPITPNSLLMWIWKSCCTLKIKVFAWMLIMDRLKTKDMLERRHWNITDEHNCILCPSHSREDRNHFFFQFNFSIRIWNYLQIYWHAGNDMTDIAVKARKDFAKPFFAKVVFTAWWNIWITRNGKVFRNERPTLGRWRAGFIHDISLLAHRIKARYKDKLLRWVSNLPPLKEFLSDLLYML